MSAQFDPYHKWLGIPPKDQPPHHYRLLGIELFESDAEVIDAAANRVMAYLHDMAVGDASGQSQKLLNEISAARICLLNQQRKTAYDQQLKSRLRPEPTAPAAPAPAASRGRTPVTAPRVDGVRGTSSDHVRWPTWTPAIGGMLVLGLIAGLGIVVVNAVRGTNEGSAEQHKVNQRGVAGRSDDGVTQSTTLTRPLLILDWAPAERFDAVLEINGKRHAIPADGDIAIPLDAGPFELHITRPGYEDVLSDDVVARGEQIRYSPSWKPKEADPAIGAPLPTDTTTTASTPRSPTMALPRPNRSESPSKRFGTGAEHTPTPRLPDPNLALAAKKLLFPPFLDLPPHEPHERGTTTPLLSPGLPPQVRLRLVGGETVLDSAALQMTPRRAAKNAPRYWVVHYVDRTQQRAQIAEFVVAEGTLRFRWSADAQLREAIQLRNTLLEIDTGKQNVLLPLRPPVKVDPLVLSGRGKAGDSGIGSNGTGQVKINVETLPEIARLRFEPTRTTGASSFARQRLATGSGLGKKLIIDLGDNEAGFPLKVEVVFHPLRTGGRVVDIQYRLSYLSHDMTAKPLTRSNVNRDLAWLRKIAQQRRVAQAQSRDELQKRNDYYTQLQAVASGASRLELHFRIILPIEGDQVVLTDSEPAATGSSPRTANPVGQR